jgi:hypothetical protein
MHPSIRQLMTVIRLILLQSIDVSADLWGPHVIPTLSRDYRVIVPDAYFANVFIYIFMKRSFCKVLTHTYAS